MNNQYYQNQGQNISHHTHEYGGNTSVSGMSTNAHNHRIAGISSEAIEVAGGHIHEIFGNTTFDDDHIHKTGVRTGLQIPIGGNKHVHFAIGKTTTDYGHNHDFSFITMI